MSHKHNECFCCEFIGRSLCRAGAGCIFWFSKMSAQDISGPKGEPCEIPESEGEEDDKSMSGDDEDDDGLEDEILQRAKQALISRKVTLSTLINEGIIEAGLNVLSVDYLGQRFEADLLENGKIKWNGSEEMFVTPSAWALHCKRMVNPIKRSGSGWATVKYKGKSLDLWRSILTRRHRGSAIKPHPNGSPFSSMSSSSTTSSLLPSAMTATTATTTGSSASSFTSVKPLLSLSASQPTLSSSISNITTAFSSTDVSTTANSASLAIPSSVASTTTSTSASDSGSSIAMKSAGLRNEGDDKIAAAASFTSSFCNTSSKSLSALLSRPPFEANRCVLNPAAPTTTTGTAAALTSFSHLVTASKLPELLKDGGSVVGANPPPPRENPIVKDSSFINSTLMAHLKYPLLVGKGQSAAEIAATIAPPTANQTNSTITSAISSTTPHPIGTKRPLSVLQPTAAKGLVETMNRDFYSRDRKCLRYSDIDMRTPDLDLSTLVQCEHFDHHKKLQPFSVLVSTNALLLMDFHCHLTTSEVVGYLGGRWDAVKQILTIEQSFPILCRFADKTQAPVVEEEIRRRMKSRKLMVVGWYHSHPYCPAQPSLRDVDCQMAYQLQMRGASSAYHPCIGFIQAPYENHDEYLQGFWAMPNLEHTASLNIPMHISYTLRRDLSLTEDILIDMKLLSEYYSGAPDRVQFKEKWKKETSYLDKLRASLATKLPEDQIHSGTFLDYMQQLLGDMK